MTAHTRKIFFTDSFNKAAHSMKERVLRSTGKVLTTAMLGIALAAGAMAGGAAAQTTAPVQSPTAVSIVLPPTELPKPLA